jgi:hypothetical protein
MAPTDAKRAAERGIALIVTMMAALLLVALAGVLAPLAMIETAVGANHRRSVQALYAAEAALELATAELGSLPDWSGVLNGAFRSAFRSGSLAPAMPGGERVDLSVVADRLRTDGAGASEAGRGLEWRLYAYGPLGAWAPVPAGYGPWLVAVWIADDAADPDPDRARDGNDAIVAHAAAYGPRRAARAVQATLTRVTVSPPPPAPPVTGARLTSWRIVR